MWCGDPEAFTIPCTIGVCAFPKSLYNLGASINLMSLMIFTNLRLDEPKWTNMRLLMADHKIKRSVGVVYDVSVKVDKFMFLIDSVSLDCKIDIHMPLILGKTILDNRKNIG